MNPWDDFFSLAVDLIVGLIAIGLMTWEAKQGRTVGDMSPLTLFSALALLIVALT